MLLCQVLDINSKSMGNALAQNSTGSASFKDHAIKELVISNCYDVRTLGPIKRV